ncbi:hypothetical protein DC083_05950 [Ignatzschineria ureiclastica]|uniref:Metal ABC transporter permease n=1 Tax=Ignatzschineria ureiclastica TaxID=472582 RepID=A0A2U2ADC9_9GAMM|nr:metal ABC transporter permease [Ignatzschineria ureiclastica]PWD80664.1 hypothetical protein DC083_05950 [Ignatzschineria ureiclastica]GGZ95468.1 chelated iron transport system membrane protein YfeC [Ignatzschineria ureiclastica]
MSLAILLEPFEYQYMVKAIIMCLLVGAACAFLSAYLVLKGWSLMGDALSHSVVPGVAGAYALNLPYAIGAFFTGILAALAMGLVKHFTKLREDAIIGLVFSSFFAAGLLIISLNPTHINVNSIIFGNVLGISDGDAWQATIITIIAIGVLFFYWKDLMLLFFDEVQASTIGLPVHRLKILFFVLLSACTVAALQTVGAILVIAMVITPGATAYLLTDRFGVMLSLSILIGALTSFIGAYVSFFLPGGSTGSLIVVLQSSVFLFAFLFAPKHGQLAKRRAIRIAQDHNAQEVSS